MKMQGTCADLMKRAMIEIARGMEMCHLQSVMVIQVHDELIFDAVPSEIPQLSQIVSDAFSNAPELSIPMKAKLSVGHNWLDAEDHPIRLAIDEADVVRALMECH